MSVSKTSHPTDVLVEFDSSTFPIIGAANTDIQKMIETERRVSASDLWHIPQMVLFLYEDPFDGSEDEWIQPSKVVVRREQEKLVLEGWADIYVPEQAGSSKYVPHPTTPYMNIATAKVGLSRLMRFLKEYSQGLEDNAELANKFAQAGRIAEIERMEVERANLHTHAASLIEDLFKGQNLGLRVDNSKGRFFVTALLMHVLPGKSFENMAFIKGHVAVKYKQGAIDSRSVRPDWRDGEENPFGPSELKPLN